ncbi:hypothetical protein LSPH26S_03825 [Lysinibacillus sphaericus]
MKAGVMAALLCTTLAACAPVRGDDAIEVVSLQRQVDNVHADADICRALTLSRWRGLFALAEVVDPATFDAEAIIMPCSYRSCAAEEATSGRFSPVAPPTTAPRPTSATCREPCLAALPGSSSARRGQPHRRFAGGACATARLQIGRCQCGPMQVMGIEAVLDHRLDDAEVGRDVEITWSGLELRMCRIFRRAPWVPRNWRWCAMTSAVRIAHAVEGRRDQRRADRLGRFAAAQGAAGAGASARAPAAPAADSASGRSRCACRSAGRGDARRVRSPGRPRPLRQAETGRHPRVRPRYASSGRARTPSTTSASISTCAPSRTVCSRRASPTYSAACD